jgi:hypothetical protein
LLDEYVNGTPASLQAQRADYTQQLQSKLS